MEYFTQEVIKAYNREVEAVMRDLIRSGISPFAAACRAGRIVQRKRQGREDAAWKEIKVLP